MKSKKLLSVFLCAVMLFSVCVPAMAAADDIDYAITNPYKNINWEKVHPYKTALHVHTNASDGDNTMREVLERHAETGYEMVASTDHGTCNKTWSKANYSSFIYGVLKLVGKTEGALDYLEDSGAFSKGMTYTLSTAENGDDYLKVSNGKTIMRIPYGIENGAVSVNAHVNSWFAEYQDNGICDYEKTVKGVSKAGAICVINHPGEYTKAKSDLTSEDAYNENNPAYRYFINKYYGLIDKYDCCIGLDINSKGDSRTRYERELWDIMLQRRTAKGKNVYAIASSDAHQLNKIDTGFTYILLEEQTSAAAKKAMEAGEMFPASHCNGNYLELTSLEENLLKYYGESELYTSIKTVTDAMEKRVADVASGEADPDSNLGSEWSCLDGEGYCSAQTQPMITAISVDDTEDSITVNTENALLVSWIADGKIIAVTKSDNGTSTLDLDDYSDEIGTYVRAEAFGEGGVVYTQAFMLDYEGAPEYGSYSYFNIPTVDFLFAEIRTLITTIKRAFSNIGK